MTKQAFKEFSIKFHGKRPGFKRKEKRFTAISPRVEDEADEELGGTTDMSRQPPTPELVAKDLHGNEWRFRHIFRGQPRRHLRLELTKDVAAYPLLHSCPAKLHHLVSEFASRLFTYSMDIRRELSLSKYNYFIRNINNYKLSIAYHNIF
ncbi:hypothetical protein TIFTF001_039976 [Ficus carica]|uniref:TF-B3 domain-containing protein n=1 Tax=Ficus carica TaxID=3494 RepID=A0AA87YSJ7_FICCA|nr:hypothetical protein TIFTF001_039970 [Ficus carica]GMN20912.1 hypothetical protein TIFTF001_039976 [Ficus carica]